MKNNHVMNKTVPIRVTQKRYDELKRLAKLWGHTISWLANFALDFYFQNVEKEQSWDKPRQERKSQ